ncbi:weak neurotoxin 6-like protein [Lates japonicus]|uniref:Weak neurotoxin 6-like protein n=1 Tax=Lates japonicus TaxID=270547 RepID=A0AAD3NMK5_LATJO|nr:weak neurotoxin 6-like protein [Lates japonicus]
MLICGQRASQLSCYLARRPCGDLPRFSVCISAFLNNPAGAPRHFKGCYPRHGCESINRLGIGSASCCRTDLCN